MKMKSLKSLIFSMFLGSIFWSGTSFASPEDACFNHWRTQLLDSTSRFQILYQQELYNCKRFEQPSGPQYFTATQVPNGLGQPRCLHRNFCVNSTGHSIAGGAVGSIASNFYCDRDKYKFTCANGCQVAPSGVTDSCI